MGRVLPLPMTDDRDPRYPISSSLGVAGHP